jgi:S1-C subfamily serine protease
LIGGSQSASIAGSDLLVGGDVILAVSGTEITVDADCTAKMFEYFSKLKSGDSVTLRILRGGQLMELNGIVP